MHSITDRLSLSGTNCHNETSSSSMTGGIDLDSSATTASMPTPPSFMFQQQNQPNKHQNQVKKSDVSVDGGEDVLDPFGKCFLCNF